MKRKGGVLIWCLLAWGAATGSAQTQSQTDAILNLLVKKGIITQQEAHQIRAEAQSLQKGHEPQVTKRVLPTIELFGDARLRYEYRQAKDLSGDAYARSRFRYRLRFGIQGELTKNLYYGFRLETGSNPRSSNITFADDGGPWSRERDTIRVGRVYLGWKPSERFSLEAGRIANPFLSSKLIWDDDLNPEGITERFTYALTSSTSLFATFAQLLYDDGNPENPFGTGALKTDTFMLGWQAGLKQQLNDSLSVTVAPTLYHYTGEGRFSGVFDPARGRQSAINDLLILDIPMRLEFHVAGLPMELQGQVAVNLRGSDRAEAARRINPAAYPGDDDENLAYLVGLRINRIKDKGDWELWLAWLHRELFSLDPNLVDSDLFDSALNLEGIAVSLTYAITRQLQLKLSYAYADRINSDLPTGIGSDVGGGANAYLNDYHLVQTDVSYQF